MRVLIDGCFDPFHIGHARYLAAAKRFGEVLARVAPDDAIRAKERIPFQNQNEREQMFRTFGCEIASARRPWSSLLADVDYLVKGIDWYGALPIEIVQECRRTGTGLIFTATDEKHSSERV